MVSQPRADVLLVTVTKVESKAVLEAFRGLGQKERPEQIEDRTYFDLGTVNGARVWMTQTQMGSSGLGASQQAIEKGIAALSPAAVIMVGIAFGMNEAKQKIGDVLVTKQLRPYELQRVGTDKEQSRITILRGDKPPASPWLVNQLEMAELSWEGATVRFGVVLTGEKLVDNLDYRDQLHDLETEALGGEMEGTGLYVACHDKKVDWILIKAICDWADGNKGQDKDERQALAAKNAAAFVLHALQFVKVDWAHRRTTRGSSGTSMMLRTPAVDLVSSSDGQAAPAPGRSSLPRQPLFFGREEELKSIAEALAPESRTWGVLIDGPGGIGKTALAVRAGHLAPSEHFDRKIFVSAKVREMTLAGEQKLEDYMLPNFVALLTELAHELGDKDIARLPENERANTVRRLLADQRALIIIDNVETFQEPEQTRLGQFLERLPSGCKAIVTSRRRRDVAARILRLDRLAQKDAMDLLDALSETNARLNQQAEARALTNCDLDSAGWRAYYAGHTYILRRQAAEAIACADRASSHWHSSETGEWTQTVARTLRGLAYRLEKDYPKAIEAFSQTLAQWRTLDPESKFVAHALNDLAGAERAIGRLADAELHYNEALRISRENKDRQGIAIYTGNLARLAFTRKNWSRAEYLAREALTISEHIERQELIASDCRILARALARQAKLAEGLPYARRAVEIFARLKLLTIWPTRTPPYGNVRPTATRLPPTEREAAARALPSTYALPLPCPPPGSSVAPARRSHARRLAWPSS